MEIKVAQTCTSGQDLHHPFETNKEAITYIANNIPEDELYWILVNMVEYYGDYEGSNDICSQCGDTAYSEYVWTI